MTHELLFFFLQMDANMCFNPTPEGVTLSLQKIYHFRELLRRIIEEGHVPSSNFETNIGGFYHARLSPCGSCLTVKKEHQPFTSAEAITLSRDEFESLFELYPRIQSAAPALKTIYPCYIDHQNQESALICPECNPSLDYPMD